MDFSAPFQRVIFFRLLWNCTPYCDATVIPMIFIFFCYCYFAFMGNFIHGILCPCVLQCISVFSGLVDSTCLCLLVVPLQ